MPIVVQCNFRLYLQAITHACVQLRAVASSCPTSRVSLYTNEQKNNANKQTVARFSSCTSAELHPTTLCYALPHNTKAPQHCAAAIICLLEHKRTAAANTNVPFTQPWPQLCPSAVAALANMMQKDNTNTKATCKAGF